MIRKYTIMIRSFLKNQSSHSYIPPTTGSKDDLTLFAHKVNLTLDPFPKIYYPPEMAVSIRMEAFKTRIFGQDQGLRDF